MSRWKSFLQIRSGEGRLAGLVVGVMVLTSAGYSLGSTGIDALYFARLGVQSLPQLYIALGGLVCLTSLFMTGLLGRVPRTALYVFAPLAVVLILAGARLVLAFELSSVYPALWLGKEVLNSVLGLITWGLAGAVCDTRQAKRLFPLFGAGRILGAVAGGLATGPLAAGFGAENLLWLWAGAMLLTFLLARALVGLPAAVQTRRTGRRRGAPPAWLDEMQRGFHFVRRSALMRWIAVAAVLFSLLYFSLALPFTRAAVAQFPDEADLAAFLGTFNGLSTAAAFLASLFLANRLYARFGLMPMLLAFPVIYLLGFGLLAATVVAPLAEFPAVVGFRLVQMIWLSGLADPAYQAMFNAVPVERRDQVRAFIGGVPEQAGTLIAGVVLLVGEQAFAPGQLYLVGLAAAALTTLVVWRAARAYGGALLDALRAGQPGLFFAEETPFGGFRQDAAATAVATAGLADADPAVRRVSAEILGQLAPGATPSAADPITALVAALHDPDAEVRAAVLRSLARARATHALLDVAACLRDAEPEVRLQAVDTLRALAGFPKGLVAHLQPLLHDPVVAVQARAASALLSLEPNPAARDLLRRTAALGEVDERVHALNALADWGDAEAFVLIETELADAFAPSSVRRAAAAALVACGPQAIPALTAALADRDAGVRQAAAAALGRLGAPALEAVTAALFQPASEEAALLALERLPARQAARTLRRYIDQRATTAIHYNLLWRDVTPQAADDRIRLLADSLGDAARQHALNALRAAGLLGDRRALALVVDSLKSRDAAQRANALEALETVRDAASLRPLLELWEPLDPARAVVPLDQHLEDLLDGEPDAWIRAGAALAAARSTSPAVREVLVRLSEADPDPLVRQTAQHTLQGHMDTLPTLSLMERILFLRRVPLLAGLTPTDLKQVAGLASEQVFPDGEVIAEQGEPGDALFIVVSGEVRVLADQAEIARRRAGDVVGEMAVISQEPRMATLVAAGEVRTLCLDQASFETLLRERPDVSLAVMRVLCARLKEASH